MIPFLQQLQQQASRRTFLNRASAGIGTLALSSLLANQAMAEANRRVVPLLLVAAAHPGPLVVIHQGMVGRAGDGALDEFHRGAQVEQGAPL